MEWCEATQRDGKCERALPVLRRQGPQNDCLRLGSSGYAFSLIALWSLLDLELDHLAFVQCFVSIHLYGGEMHENVFARLALDESITL